MNTIIKQFSQNPKQLLIVDSAGALITFVMLLLIGKFFSIQFGLSKTIINILSLAALLIFLYSSTCYLTLRTVRWPVISSVALINSLYCFLTLSLMIYLHSEITLWGILYFSVEIIIIIFLIIIEYKVAIFIKHK